MPSQSFKLKSQVVRAGAGTGKTRNLIDEVFKVYQAIKAKENRTPNLIVCTFTIKATQELRERLYKKAIQLKDWDFLDYVQSSLYISTIDSVLQLFLRNYAYTYGLTSDFLLEDSCKENKLFNELSKKYFFDKYPHLLERILFHDLQKVLRFYIGAKLKYGTVDFFDESDFKEFNLELETYKSYEDKLEKKSDNKLETKDLFKDLESFEGSHFILFFKEFKIMAEEFFEEYLTQKKTQGCLIMDDLTLFSLDLLRNNPRVAQSFSKEWDYWFIDEYQDTSWAQEQIIKKITNFKNIFCVGDPKQSIYLFRGADPDVFKRRVTALGKEIKTLDINYRSRSSLIYFFNDFFKQKEGFLSFQPPAGQEIRPKEPCVSFLTYDNKEEAFGSTYSHIQKLLDGGSNLSDISILSRKNEHLLDLASFLKEKKINVLFHGSNSFSNNRLVLDALFVFKFLTNPYDDVNLVSLCRTPYFYLNDQKIVDLCQAYKQVKKTYLSFWSYLEEKSLEEEVIQKLKEYLELEKTKGLLKVFEQILLERSFLDLAHYQDPSGSSESNLWKLLSLLHNTANPLDLFYSFMTEDEEKNSSKEKEAVSFLNSEVIQLMTIHKSKGLEFKHVIICDLSIGSSSAGHDDNHSIFNVEKKKMAFSVPVNGRNKQKIRSFGHKKNVHKMKGQLVEERSRLFYVAMTRAKESLAFLVPSEVKKSSWLNKNSFFDSFVDIIYTNDNPKNGIKKWILKEGFVQKDNYSFVVKHNFKYSKKREQPEVSVDVLPPYKSKDIKQSYTKSSKDFCLYEEERKNNPKNIQSEINKEKNNSQKILIPLIRNKIFTMHLGSHLHYYLQILSKHSLASVLLKLDKSYLSEKEKEKMQKGLRYVSGLKDPDFNHFLKNGESEWSFKFKKENIILQGQIDLWGRKSDKELWVFDYKSSSSKSVKEQLIFYSWVLDNMYKPEMITMCEVYPFDERVKIQKYTDSHKQVMDKWLEGLI